jgi:polyferredoxin
MNRQKLRKGIILISFLFFPITLYYFSPYLIVVGAAKGIIVGSFVIFLTQFITSLTFGRAFCGWICPGGGLQECCKIVVDKKTKGGKYDLIKYVIWIPWITAITLLFINSNNNLQVDFFYETSDGISVSNGQSYIVLYGVILLIVSISLIGGRRGFCHYSCWMAPFMIIGTKIKQKLRVPSFKLIANPNKCISCKKCTKVCQMSLPVYELVQKGNMYNAECVMCGECVDICNAGVIKFEFGKK